MREIEALQDWRGQDVVDVDEQKLGKLEDVWFWFDGSDPVLLSVRSGLLGRKRHLVPLQGSTVARKHVRVAFREEQIRRAPQNADDARLTSAELSAVEEHYGIRLDGPAGGELESGGARDDRIVAAREARAAADEAEGVAAAAADEAVAAAERAAAARAEAEEASRAAAAARDRAQELRHRADEIRVPEPRAPTPGGPEG